MAIVKATVISDMVTAIEAAMDIEITSLPPGDMDTLKSIMGAVVTDGVEPVLDELIALEVRVIALEP